MDCVEMIEMALGDFSLGCWCILMFWIFFSIFVASTFPASTD